ncbi:GGDEF domain-containing protein [Pseudodesulfovibrio senegalensis]|jgi:diguanylate cyclase (GGDEF)-like protein|uniref:diguanylate cyclase n=1 Tax=Pseudodesulfovibrio senegalensis TaxID=1721087 RepID=A0A6N6N2N5_9BACT|nr:GGDEF domain-containing protein [Pseudodesulfovibrio senegalensis]KAB1441675.1 GGDEF domain-containing protein [Pseudodesulfovibrio senegalensis]
MPDALSQPKKTRSRRARPGARKRAVLLYSLSLSLLGLILLLNFGLLYNEAVAQDMRPDRLMRLAYLLMLGGILVMGAQALLIFKGVLANLDQDRRKADELSEKVAQLTVIDDLTKAFNRFKFDSVMARELENIRRYKSVLSGVMFDIDGFRAINEKHGYNAGDAVLVHLARYVNKRIRKTDYLFRWRGGKFIILTPHADREKAAQAADKLKRLIAATPFSGSITLTVSLSVTQAKGTDTMESFLQRLQAGLTSAKNKGRDQVCTV